MNLELTKDEAKMLASLLDWHVAIAGKPLPLLAIGTKLHRAGVSSGNKDSLKWHVNALGNIQIDSFNN